VSEIKIIVAEKVIRMGITCPHCKIRYKTNIKIVKSECPECKKAFEKDISLEKAFEFETAIFSAWIILKELQNNDSIEIQARFQHAEKTKYMLNLFTEFGLRIKDQGIKRATNDKTGEKLTVNYFILEKEDYLLHYKEARGER